jgi:hypothetical protein
MQRSLSIAHAVSDGWAFTEAQGAYLVRKYLVQTKMPDVDSSDPSSGIAVDVQQRLNCALP